MATCRRNIYYLFNSAQEANVKIDQKRKLTVCKRVM